MPDRMKTFTSFDGEDIFYRAWGRPAGSAVIVYLHGIESHTGWFADTGEMLSKRGYAVYALERRGSGVNRENRGFLKSYKALLEDIERFLELVKNENPGKKVYLMGLCWGGKLAVLFAGLKPDMLDGLILVTPALRTRVDLSPFEKADVFLSSLVRPRKLFNIPIEDEMFTKNPAYLEFIRRDHLKLTRATAKFFMESAKMDMRIGAASRGIKMPIFLLLAGDDRIVDNPGVEKWFKGQLSADKTFKKYSGSCHSLEFEDEAGDLVEDISRWIDERKDK